LRRDLERAAAELPNLEVEFVDGGHGLLFEHPRALVNRIRRFLNVRQSDAEVS
jgi:surfactin synthase thioesterase subunit